MPVQAAPVPHQHIRGVRQTVRASLRPTQDSLTLVRLIALVLLLLLAVAEPEPTRTGYPAWSFVAFYAGYSLLAAILGRRWDWLRTRVLPILDLALAGVIYLVSGSGDGAMYTLVIVGVVSAASTLPLPGALAAVAAATLILIAGDLLRQSSWSLDTVIADIGNRLLALGFVAVVAVVLARRVHDQESETEQAHLHAERLAELDRLRGAFVAAVSHELQTPLTAARAGLGMLEASAHERLTAEEVRLLANARRSVDRLGLQINDLVSLNQIEANVFTMTPAELDLRGVIAAVLSVAHPLLAQKSQALQVDAPGPLLVHGDRQRLEQALLNLVINAHQHSPPGTAITIAGKTAAGGVVIQVTDTGPGIPRDVQGRIFDRFYRLDAAPGGSGLGLSIVKAIAESHGGQVTVESEPGQGATFTLFLPAGVASGALKETHGAAESADCR